MPNKNKAWNYTLDIECEKCGTKEFGIYPFNRWS
jgi:hypothetical protein